MNGSQMNLADELAHERNVLRTMIDLIPAFIYAKDAHSRFTAANKLVANRMGVEPEELIGKTDFDFFPREMAEKFFADEQALIKSGKPLVELRRNCLRQDARHGPRDPHVEDSTARCRRQPHRHRRHGFRHHRPQGGRRAHGLERPAGVHRPARRRRGARNQHAHPVPERQRVLHPRGA
jgi:PAS domain S-box-containing protein